MQMFHLIRRIAAYSKGSVQVNSSLFQTNISYKNGESLKSRERSKGRGSMQRIDQPDSNPPLNHTGHPSTQCATSPPKTGNRIPSSPAYDSPRCAPRTSTTRTPREFSISVDSVRWDAPSTSGNRPRIPSTDTGARTISRIPAYPSAARCSRLSGTSLPSSAIASR